MPTVSVQAAGSPMAAPARVRDLALGACAAGGLRAWLLLEGGAAAAVGLAGSAAGARVRLREAAAAEALSGSDSEADLQLQV